MSGTRSAVALGANLGNPERTLRAAITALNRSGVIHAVSPLYRTAPVGGPPGQPDYFNQVVLLTVPAHVPAAAMLAELHRIEHEHGRERTEHWGARTLDLDLLWFGTTLSTDPALLLPHPRLAGRAFVLVPLVHALHTAGWTWTHPQLGKQPSELLAARPASEIRTVRPVRASF